MGLEMTAQLRIRLVFIELQTIVFVVIDVGGLLKKNHFKQFNKPDRRNHSLRLEIFVKFEV